MNWTSSETKWLINNYPNKGKDACALHLNRTSDSVKKKAQHLRLRISTSGPFFSQWRTKVQKAKKNIAKDRLIKQQREIFGMSDNSSSSVKGIVLHLPWPPTANTYWRHSRGRHYISPKGVSYRDEVDVKARIFAGLFPKTSKLSVHIDAFPPDNRRRDLDNLCKCLLDSIQKAGVYEDDFQIDMLSLKRQPLKEGKVIVYINKIEY